MNKSYTDSLDGFDPSIKSRDSSLSVISDLNEEESVEEPEILGDNDISTEEDPNINVELDVYGAAARNEVDRLKELIGSEITDERKMWADNAMHLAAAHNSIECGKFLITFHPNVLKVLDNQKLSPIDIARRHGNIDFINMCWQERMKLLDDRDVVVRQVI